MLNNEILLGDGKVRVQVSMDLMVFRPLEGQVLTGKIKHQTRNGIFVCLGDNLVNMVVPAPQNLREGSFWNEKS